MRVLAATLVVLLMLAPGAAARSPAALALSGPGEPLAPVAGEAVPLVVDVRLSLEDFSCLQDTEFPVQVVFNYTEAVRVSPSNLTLWFAVPAGSYVGAAWEGSLSAAVDVRGVTPGHADVRVFALFAGDAQGCVTRDGFEAVGSALDLEVEVAQPAPPPQDEGAPPETNETPEEVPPTPSTPPARATPGDPCAGAVNANCGLIGEYDAPSESVRQTPGAGAALVAAAVVGAALVARRRRG